MDIDIRTLRAPQESALEDALEALSPSEKISPGDDICGVFSWWFSLKEKKRLQLHRSMLNMLTLIFTAVSFNLGVPKHIQMIYTYLILDINYSLKKN